MSLTNVNKALVKAFADGSFFDKAKVAQENITFNPPNGEAWAKLFFFPGEGVVATLGAGGTDRYDGFLQIDLNYPLNKGTADIGAKADAIINAFTAGKRFTNSGQEVILKTCGRSPGRTKDGTYTVSVSVYWYAYVIRPS